MAINKLTFAGHSAVLLHTDTQVIGIDPWLEGNPRCPETLKNPEKLDLIVLTHGHADHAGDAVRLANKFGATIAATYELAATLVQEGVAESQIQFMNKGGTVTIGDVKVTLTHALHSNSYDTKDRGTVYAGEACGAIISDGSNTIYHAGDTCFFKEMKSIGKQYRPNIALLPIGDTYTMGPKEAAYCAKKIGAELNIPIHFGPFDLLTGTPEQFSEACSEYSVETLALEPGQSHTI
ncbi:MAG: metal-dependent hydrolase [Deltaproteobacteria bacterium]|nr:metal-dependent hydrolase [Deltaproteobacteria bacterium]